MASLIFDGEAAESFANVLQHFDGFTVEVTTESGDVFDAVLAGSGVAEADDYFAVRVRRFDEALSVPVGDVFVVVVESLRVY